MDRQIGVVRLERPDGTLIALIANYAIHGTVMNGQNLLVSGDAPGTVSAYLEQKLGAPALFVNGAAGNLSPIYHGHADAKSGHLSEFRVLLGDHILAALGSIGHATGDVALQVEEKTIATPRREGLEWPEELNRYAAPPEAPGGPARIKLPVRFLRLNDTLIWSAPVELFCEVAIAVRNQSPFAHTFYFGYTNGWFGYLPTAQAFAEGGYEPKTSPFTSRAEADVTQGVIAFAQGMR